MVGIIATAAVFIANPALGTAVASTVLAPGVESVAVATGAGATASVGGGVTAAGAGVAVAVSTPVIIAGAALVGAEVGVSITWDCWKPVVHEESEAPSAGMTLKELAEHENVEMVITGEYDQIIILNKFGENRKKKYQKN